MTPRTYIGTVRIGAHEYGLHVNPTTSWRRIKGHPDEVITYDFLEKLHKAMSEGEAEWCGLYDGTKWFVLLAQHDWPH